MHRRRPRIAAALVAAAAALAATASPAQVPPGSPSGTPNQYPPPLPRREGPPPPRLALEPESETPLKGPLPSGALRLADGRIVLGVADGLAEFSLDGTASVRVIPGGVPAPSPPPIAYDASGRFRYVATDDAHVVAERRSRRNPERWKREWRLRLPAAVLGAPVIVGDLLCFAALDDQVYALRRDNGHRLWAVDIGERISRPLAWWNGRVATPTRRGRPPVEGRFDVLLVVPDGGASLIALDAFNGQRLVTYPAGVGRGFVSPPLVLPESRIALARQGYRDDDAALVVLRITSPDARPGPDTATDVPYNPPPSPPSPTEGR